VYANCKERQQRLQQLRAREKIESALESMCIKEEEKESAWPELRARKKRDAADDCLQSLGDGGADARKWKEQGKQEGRARGGDGVKPTVRGSLHLL